MFKTNIQFFLVKIKILIVFLFLLFLFIFGLAYSKGFIPSSVIKPKNATKGMLKVVTNCGIPEGCGPKYRLYDSEIKEPVALLGEINDSDNELIIEVFGYETDLPDNQKSMLNKEKDMKTIKVTKYNVLSKIPYHSFLISESQDYMLERFGCTCKGPYNCKFYHDKSFSWEYSNMQPILKVKWSQDYKWVELWYDGNNGEFIKEVINPPTAVFCPN